MAVNPLIRSVITVVIFWWLVLLGLAFLDAPRMFTTPDGIAFMVHFVGRGVKFWVAGFAGTLFAIIAAAIANRIVRARSLRAGRMRGVHCTLGPVPLARAGLPKAPSPDLADGERYEYGPEILAWIQSNRESHPKHVDMLEAVIQVLASREWLPASHIPGGHGNRSLLDHSLRVAAMAMKFAPTFEYAGLVTRFASTPMRDPSYRFNGADPLIPILGVAHDLGKMLCFIVDRGRVVSAKPNHDLVSARMLALMDELYELPPADREALLRAVAHYHHESAYPVAPDGRVERDRDVALLLLLIKADNAAGKHEGQHFMGSDAYAQWLIAREESGDHLDAEEKALLDARKREGPAAAAGGGHIDAAQAISAEAVLSALKRVLLAPKAISRDTKTRGDVIGQVNLPRPPQWAEDILREGGQLDADQAEMLRQAMMRRIVLREDLLRKALSAALGIQPRKRGDGRYDLSIRALEVLYEQGILDNECADGFVTPHSALFHVNWINRKTFQDLAMWRNAIVLKPAGFLASFDDGDVHDSYFQIVRPVWRDRLVRPGGDDQALEDDVDAGSAVDFDDGEEVLDRSAMLDEAAREAAATDDGRDQEGEVASAHADDAQDPVEETGPATDDAIAALMRGNVDTLRRTAEPAPAEREPQQRARPASKEPPPRPAGSGAAGVFGQMPDGGAARPGARARPGSRPRPQVPVVEPDDHPSAQQPAEAAWQEPLAATEAVAADPVSDDDHEPLGIQGVKPLNFGGAFKSQREK